ERNERSRYERPERDPYRLMPEARCPEDARGDDERSDARRVLIADRRLVAVARKQVDRELGHGTEEQQRLEQPEPQERNEEQDEIKGLVPGRDGVDERHRVGDELVRHPPRRPTDRVVPTDEGI